MNVRKKLLCSAVATVAIGGFSVSAANAALIQEVAGSAEVNNYVIPTNNDYAPLVGTVGTLGGSLEAVGTDPIKLTFEYLFKEAGYINTFNFGGTEVFNTSSSGAGDTYSTIWNGGAGLLDFKFTVNSGSGNVTNAGNDGTANANFFMASAGMDSFYLLLDDSGAGPDDNHDDLILKVTASKVPEPGTLALLGLGLAGLALRFKAKK
ncbi:PEP-CTERM sorting domain-containing protein [Marinobacter flavimaris]|uniref:PEP-CTERM sorting domain-containing protein n=1 Tax=Marinobacter flavimaris TaxID=262076 RepID=UPI003863A261